MEIFVDGDACPVKAEVVRVAERHNALVHIVSNAFMKLPDSHLVKRVIVDHSFDAADDWIAEHTLDIDLVMECSGQVNTLSAAEKHCRAGAKKVLLSNPGEANIPARPPALSPAPQSGSAR